MSVQVTVIVSAILLCFSALEAEAHRCQCRNRGVMYELGQTSCLHVDGRNYMARCEMKLNVSSWTKVEDGCPISDAGEKASLMQ